MSKRCRCRDVGATSATHPKCRIQIRVYTGQDIALGPCKANLLEAIGAFGSLRAAAQHLGMSYVRAWLLVKAVNRCFREPLVTFTRGGPRGGRAELTADGKRCLTGYRAMEKAGLKAMVAGSRTIGAFLRC